VESKSPAREVGDSLFIIGDLPRLRFRTLRALEFHERGQPGIPLRSTPAKDAAIAPRYQFKELGPLLK